MTGDFITERDVLCMAVALVLIGVVAGVGLSGLVSWATHHLRLAIR